MSNLEVYNSKISTEIWGKNKFMGHIQKKHRNVIRTIKDQIRRFSHIWCKDIGIPNGGVRLLSQCQKFYVGPFGVSKK